MSSPFTVPLRVDVRALVDRPGVAQTRTIVTGLAQDLAVGLARVDPEGTSVSVRLESVSDGILATAQVEARSVAECSRCLDEVQASLTTTVSELFRYHAEDDADEDGTDEPAALVVEDAVVLDDLVRDSLALALPTRPLCRSDCPGLCPECGARLADDPQHGHASNDPRWAPLAALAAAMEPAVGAVQHEGSTAREATVPPGDAGPPPANLTDQPDPSTVASVNGLG